jgi:hypothetical protein
MRFRYVSLGNSIPLSVVFLESGKLQPTSPVKELSQILDISLFSGAQGRNRTTDTAIFSRILIVINQGVMRFTVVNIDLVTNDLRANCQHTTCHALDRSKHLTFDIRQLLRISCAIAFACPAPGYLPLLWRCGALRRGAGTQGQRRFSHADRPEWAPVVAIL